MCPTAPGIKQAFTDPASPGSRQAGPRAAGRLAELRSNLPAERLANKYNALLKNSVYVTTAEAKRFDANNNTRASVKYLFVPYGTRHQAGLHRPG